MPLTGTDLALIRDEIGDATPPTDDDLSGSFDTLGSWAAVALRVLKRRRAALVGSSASAGGVSSLAIPGVVSVGLSGGKAATSTSLAALDEQIRRLELALAQEGEPTSTQDGHLVRVTAR